jgi:hypothetical protein
VTRDKFPTSQILTGRAGSRHMSRRQAHAARAGKGVPAPGGRELRARAGSASAGRPQAASGTSGHDLRAAQATASQRRAGKRERESREAHLRHRSALAR